MPSSSVKRTKRASSMPLLSFSETDRAKYKEIAGALKEAFGVQRKVKVLDTPAAQNIIARAFDRELILRIA